MRVRYMHSDIDAIERMEIVRGLRLGEFDVLVGINLLREGLDLPEVSLVAILDADKEGFLRSDRSLIQTVGRAARHVQRAGDLLRRPDHRLDAALHRRDRRAAARSSARTTTSTASRRRRCRRASIRCGSSRAWRMRAWSATRSADRGAGRSPRPRRQATRWSISTTLVAMLEQQMREAAAALDFEAAARLRDQLFEVKATHGGEREPAGSRRRRGIRRAAVSVSGASDGEAHAPLVPRARRSRARSRWTRRSCVTGASEFGRAAHPPLLVTLDGRPRCGKDDARPGDLRGLRRDARRSPARRSRSCTSTRRRGRPSTTSICIASIARSELDEHRLGRDPERARRWCWSSGRSARATDCRAGA